MIEAPNLAEFPWLRHGFGLRDTVFTDQLTTVRQIHSNIVINAEAAELEPEGDALISNRAAVVVAVKTADCVPILLVDPITHSVAAIHAGWRGTAAQIVAAAVNQLATHWNVRAKDLRAAIGPSIGKCCYEVGPDVARHFGTWVPELNDIDTPVHIDLPAINEAQLREAGVSDVWISRECTFCAPQRFYSFRREREQSGRMFSFIGLR